MGSKHGRGIIASQTPTTLPAELSGRHQNVKRFEHEFACQMKMDNR